MPEQPTIDQLEPYQRLYQMAQDNLRTCGTLYISKTGRSVGGWLVDSYSAGKPFWDREQHWLDKRQNTLYHASLAGERHQVMNLYGEDTNIDPARAKFIRESVSKWEQAWLAQADGRK